MNSNSEVAQRANHQVAKSAADELLLTLAIDRVLGAPRQVWSVTDNDGNDDFDADRGDSPSLIDWTSHWHWPLGHNRTVSFHGAVAPVP